MKYTSFFLMPLLVSYMLSLVCTHNQQPLFSHGKTEFVIVIPSYNNEQWARENLHSACTQKSSQPYQVICINDCSLDRTGEIMDTYVKEHNLESMVTVIHNTERLGAMANWYNTIHKHIPDHKVVVNFDGDDLFMHDKVLLTLEKYYKDPTVWLTYGSALSYPNEDWELSDQIPDWVFTEGKIREYPFVASHLRTFKAGLFKKIKKEDLFIEGADLAPDMAFMLPMLEMCSPSIGSQINHSRHISEFLYCYRTNNPINLFRILKKEQVDAGNRIAAMKPYSPLDYPVYRGKISRIAEYIAAKYPSYFCT